METYIFTKRVFTALNVFVLIQGEMIIITNILSNLEIRYDACNSFAIGAWRRPKSEPLFLPFLLENEYGFLFILFHIF